MIESQVTDLGKLFDEYEEEQLRIYRNEQLASEELDAVAEADLEEFHQQQMHAAHSHEE